jgi:flagellar hook-length control protein FliK
VASPLTVTTNASAGIGATKGQTQAGAEAEGGLMGAFAALLGAANQQAGANASAETTTDLSQGNLVNLSFGAGFGSEAGEQAEDPDAIAAAIDVALPIQAPIVTSPVLTDLVDSLADLKLSLDAGEPVDPELLKRIDAALSDLAAEFDIDLAALPSLDDLKALATAILPGDTSVEAQLTTALAPLAETLLTGTAETELSAQIKSIGEKLAALLQSLNGDDIDSDKLAALGLDADTTIDADLEAAIAKLVNPPVKVDATATAPVLATPTLKLTEPALTGKAAVETTASVEPTAETRDTTEPGLQLSTATSEEPDTDGKPDDDRKPVETKATATASVAASVETPVDPAVTAQPTHVASRIDAAAARPVIQAGYQTSQQQLNLPQLAFELVRQVNDGNTRFQMRLDPPELGKIDVRLDIDASGQVNAKLIVERAETLDLMQRDQRGLEKALQQAGLDSAKTNLEFSLKQSPFSGGQQGQDGNGRQPLFGADVTADAEDVPPPTINLYRGSLTASGVNIIA